MMRTLILIICAIAACTAFFFFWSTTLFLMMKRPGFGGPDIPGLLMAFGLFLAASTTVTTAWQRKKAALWCWIPVFLVGAPITTYWAYETTKMPADIQFTRDEDAAERSALGEVLSPTRAEFDEVRRAKRIISLGLLGILSFQTVALVLLHRKQVLQ
ncbi:MAG: hypothetical protein AAF608_15115 [Pseudomonadota bacterium]